MHLNGLPWQEFNTHSIILDMQCKFDVTST